MHLRITKLSLPTLGFLVRMDRACMLYTVLIIYSMSLPHMLTLNV